MKILPLIIGIVAAGLIVADACAAPPPTGARDVSDIRTDREAPETIAGVGRVRAEKAFAGGRAS